MSYSHFNTPYDDYDIANSRNNLNQDPPVINSCEKRGLRCIAETGTVAKGK